MIHFLYFPWKELATTYSGVTIAVIALVGYFIKRVYDLKSKKVEIRYSLFQQNKITALTYFVSSYVHMDKLMYKMWVDGELSVPSVLESELESGVENFRIALNQLNLYLSPIEMNEFRKLLMNMEGMLPYIKKLRSSTNEGENLENTDILVKYVRHIALDNPKSIESIGSDTRIMFGS
jgi:hypothetical protein